MKKKIYIKESKLVSLIEKLVKETHFNGELDTATDLGSDTDINFDNSDNDLSSAPVDLDEPQEFDNIDKLGDETSLDELHQKLHFLYELNSNLVELVLMLNEDLKEQNIVLPGFNKGVKTLIGRKDRKRFYQSYFRL